MQRGQEEREQITKVAVKKHGKGEHLLVNHIFRTKILPASKHSWHHVEFILQSTSYCCHFLTAEAF